MVVVEVTAATKSPTEPAGANSRGGDGSAGSDEISFSKEEDDEEGEGKVDALLRLKMK